MKEDDILKKIYNVFNYKKKGLIIGPGDDCAVFDLGSSKYYYLLTKDDIVENTHFLINFLKPCEIASKLVRSNVSDIYSMGDAKPLYAITSAGLNYRKIDDNWILSFITSLRKELDIFGVVNAGGNLSRSKDLFFSMTVFGSVYKKKLIRRTGIKKGDLICAIGYMGSSSACVDIMKNKKRDELNLLERKLLKYFTHPPIYAKYVARISDYATSMIDNSDGLFKSLLILSRLNNLRAVVKKNMLEKSISKELYRWCFENKKDPYDYVIKGGEDYNLIFTINEKDFGLLSNKIPVYKIGHFEKGSGVMFDGYEKKINSFEHF